MKLLKRICIFLMMFWSVGFLLTLAVQLFGHNLFDIHFRRIEPGVAIPLNAGEELTVYLAAFEAVPDVALLRPEVTLVGEDGEALATKPLAIRLTRPGEAGEPIYAHSLFTYSAEQAQQVVPQWENPKIGYFLAASGSLRKSAAAFFSVVFFSIGGASLLYMRFGERVLRRLTITPPAAPQGDAVQ